jgi:hypothetical protein
MGIDAPVKSVGQNRAPHKFRPSSGWRHWPPLASARMRIRRSWSCAGTGEIELYLHRPMQNSVNRTSMHIFIDESGNFSGTEAGDSAVSVLGALMLETARLPKLFGKYEKLRRGLPKSGSGEVKGSLLNEKQVAAAIEMLRRNGAVFCASMIDMGDHTSADVERHRTQRGDSLTRGLTDKHTSELQAAVADLKTRMLRFSDPLYAQMIVTTDLLYRVLEEMIGYHCQRNPKELAEFHWVVDGKQPGLVTDWEEWWSKTIVIWLQAMSVERPCGFFKEGDYAHFQRFRMGIPDYLKEHLPDGDKAGRSATNLHLLFTESFRFSSEIEPGLELVDIVTNALRRSLVGNLGEEGWLILRRIMIHRGDVYVQPVSLLDEQKTVDRPYKKVINHFREGGRTMLAPRFRKI